MGEPDIFRAVIRKSQIRDDVMKLVSELEPGAASELLAEVAIALSRLASGSKPAQLPIPQVPLQRSRRSVIRRERPLPGVSRKEQAAELLRLHPRMPVPEIADRIYGSRNAKAQGKARTLLWSMKKVGLARNPEPGKWEVVEQAK